ncbi:MAG: alanine racemase [Proteobacteria bacterium]|nr:alanine racemase [Pseudomonadota bacterium]MBU1386825.1 alanine racemase [Pseudomonadota bacterium]MBU1544769.1 alanine racemase [Pseudomonadota bacterium]MBU2481559.1 alanine racemase [Pseudomonadota bacterium]
MEYQLVNALIDLEAIAGNIRSLKQITHPGAQFMAVVKADAYGHGAVRVAKTALKSGADWLGVARLEEAVTLRDAGITAPILIFGYVYPHQADTIIHLDLVTTIFSPEMAMALSENASTDKPVNVHIKVDTGMGRLGMIVRNNSRIAEDIESICSLPHLHVQGIYTHFASADSTDNAYTQNQIRLFTDLLADLKKINRTFEFYHAANSAGIINFPDSHFNMVRAGIAIYGCYPSNKKDTSKITLKPVMTLKSIITSVKDVPKDFCVSYGMTYKTLKKTRLASVPIGYADGFSRKFSSTGFMLVNGHKAPIVGRVCMDQTMIDVGNIPDVTPGDEVIIIGAQKNLHQTAEDLAQQIGTINYEIVSALTARVKKHYSG